MLTKTQRQAQIVAELHANPMVRITQLARTFDVTTETIRRDIAALQDRGLVDRVHGGATAGAQLRRQLDGGLANAAPDAPEDRDLAIRVLASIRDGDTLMLESGGAAAAVARQLAIERRDLLVITNGTLVAHHLGRNGTHRVLLAPGAFDPSQRAVYGVDTTAFIEKHTVGVAVVGADGLTSEGAQADRTDAGAVRGAMLTRASRTVVTVPAGGFDRGGFRTFAPLATIRTVVAETRPPAAIARALRHHGVDVSHGESAPIRSPGQDRPAQPAHLPGAGN